MLVEVLVPDGARVGVGVGVGVWRVMTVVESGVWSLDCFLSTIWVGSMALDVF